MEEKQLSSGEYKKCPYCAETIKAEAVLCKHCGKDYPQEKPEPEPTKEETVVELIQTAEEQTPNA